jgi:thiosulfate/3-mercaptopyruvate sulfurtransferase
VLDGGWQAWIGEGLPTEEGLNMPTAREFVGAARPAMLRTADSLFEGGTLVIDSRAASRYRGDEEPIDKVAGHIPGAKNFFWGGIIGPNGRMLPPAELRAKLQRVIGDTPPEHCVFYCGSGVTSAANVLAMEVAGLTGSMLYSGSWSEWSSDPSRAIAKGEE